MSEPVTVAIINYNGEKYLRDEIESIKASDYPDISIMMVDDCSTDGSVELVQKYFSDVEIFSMDYNKRLLGKYPLANRVRNKAIRETKTRLLYILDNDVTLAKDCISKLVETINTLDDCAVCTPRVMYAEDRDMIYSDGAILHYVGTSVVRNRNVKISRKKEDPKYSVGCGIQLFDINKAEKVGYINENYIAGWGDDGEFHQRMNIAGYRCYNVPQALIYHPKKEASYVAMAHVKNRLWLILENYSLRTIILAMPSFLLYELSLMFFLLMKGGIKDYFLGIKDVIVNFKTIMKNRKKVQSMRVIPDRELLSIGDFFLTSHNVGGNNIMKIGITILVRFYDLYWKIIKNLI